MAAPCDAAAAVVKRKTSAVLTSVKQTGRLQRLRISPALTMLDASNGGAEQGAQGPHVGPDGNPVNPGNDTQSVLAKLQKAGGGGLI